MVYDYEYFKKEILALTSIDLNSIQGKADEASHRYFNRKEQDYRI